ncbi:MAG TPA: carboxypeptidase-like regulatory domain-containing protein [Vicinamibacterales bacterium]|nr:carboxypeptidase-like regulatory domain-containing protein [Vicinamibacterales bacterium]
MRTITSLVAALLLVAAAARAQVSSSAGSPPGPPATTTQPAHATAVLRGHVLAGDTGQPLRQARLILMPMDGRGGVSGGTVGGSTNHVTMTDANGAYEFRELPAGRYTLTASKSPYIGLSYGQTHPFEGGTTLTVQDDQTLERIDFSLPRGSVVRGRALDEYGEPLSNLQVAALRSQTIGGRRQLMPSGRMVLTDDLGEFRLFGLQPGDYVVQAVWRKFPGAVGAADDGVGYAPTYFPATTQEAEAQRIAVGIGTTVSDVTIMMSPTTTASISGTVVDSHGQPMVGVLMVGKRIAGGTNSAAGVQIRPDGSFVARNLTPGEYILQGVPRPLTEEAAVMNLTVAGADIADLRLVASRAVSVTGRIVVDPGQPLATNALSVVMESTSPDATMSFLGLGPGKVLDDNTFALKSGPGVKRVRVFNLPTGWNVRAVRLGGVDVTDSGIDIKPGEDVGGVDVELTGRLTSIVGRVTDAHGDAAHDYTALIFPQDQSLWSNAARYIKIGRPDQDGRFTVAGLPPGDYVAVALAHIDAAKIGDPDFLNSLRSGARTFSLGEAETKPLDLKLSSGS